MPVPRYPRTMHPETDRLRFVYAQPDASESMPPLVAVTFSALNRTEYAPRLLNLAEQLLDSGADPNQTWIDPRFPDSPLSALYGAAGKNHSVPMTRLLLERGANPNDGESLYHSLEDQTLACTRLLLANGASPKGANAINKALDYDNLEALRLVLGAGADPNENNPIHHAIRRRRSPAHFAALLAAGAIPRPGSYRLAMLAGLPDSAALLPPEPLSPADLTVAAFARGERPAVAVEGLNALQLRVLPDLAAAGCWAQVRTMVESGWPIDVRGGDIGGSALNQAVFQGNAEMTRFLMAHGADWRTPHNYNDNVMGTLSFASRRGVPGSLECARALIEGGMPVPDANYCYPPEITAYFASIRVGSAPE